MLEVKFDRDQCRSLVTGYKQEQPDLRELLGYYYAKILQPVSSRKFEYPRYENYTGSL